MTFGEHMTERPPCNNGERNATLEEAARAVETLSPVATDAATVGMAIRALKSHAPTTPPTPTHGERITDLIWAQFEDRPLGLARTPEERKRDLAATIDAALAGGKGAPPAPPSDPGTLDAAYGHMAEAAGEQIRAATKLALKQNDGARDLNMWRAGLDRANGLVAAAFSRLHAALAGKERP